MNWRERKRWLRARLDGDVTRELAQRSVDVILRAEIAGQRVLDRRAAMPPFTLPSELTAIIKTFERPREVRRLVASIRRQYPELPVLVVDDSREPSELAGVGLLRMPYNSGISAGRNAALERIDTPYFLLLDDDFVFYRRTKVADSLATIRSHPDIDILGGRVVNLPDFATHDYLRSRELYGGIRPVHPVGGLLGGLPVYSKVPNFFIGRTASVRSVGWREDLKVMEHQEFFDRAYGVLTTVYDERMSVLHARNPFDRASPERQRNMASSAVVLSEIRRLERMAGGS